VTPDSRSTLAMNPASLPLSVRRSHGKKQALRESRAIERYGHPWPFAGVQRATAFTQTINRRSRRY